MTAINPNLARVFSPPVMEARRWLADATFPEDRPLINVSQAAPVDPPPVELAEAMARAMIEEPSAHAYGPVLGNADLREKVAENWGRIYGARISAQPKSRSRRGAIRRSAPLSQRFAPRAMQSSFRCPGTLTIRCGSTCPVSKHG